MSSKPPTLHFVFLLLFLFVFIWSLIDSHDYFIWALEVFPAIIALVIIIYTYKKFPLSDLLYGLILLHSCILLVGAKYTYAEVPLFNWIKEVCHHSRNNYDKIGHFVQGFVPAIVARELLIRNNILTRKGWRNFLIVCTCLAISAFYELVEAFVAIVSGTAADAFLGTQGYVWDTQSDMFLALSGSILALILLGKCHDRSMNKLFQKI